MTCFCFCLKGAHFAELISVPSVVNGIKGKPLYVAVEKKFNEDGVRFQGTWYQISPKSTHLVTFENSMVIHSMLLKETVKRITPPNISLNFTCLEETDEGDYQLTIHITHTDHNESETVIKNVRITVNGKNGFSFLIWQLQALYENLWKVSVFWFGLVFCHITELQKLKKLIGKTPSNINSF